MKSFLGLQRLANQSVPIPRRGLKEVSIDGCTPEKTIELEPYWDGEDMATNGYIHIHKELAANDFICFNNAYTIFLFGNDLTVEGNALNSEGTTNKIDPTKNVIGVELGEWKVSASSATTVDLMGVAFSTVVFSALGDISGYLVLDSWEGTLKGSYTLNNEGSPTISGDIMIFALNTNSAQITGTTSQIFMDGESGTTKELNVEIPRTIEGSKNPYMLAYLVSMDAMMETPGTHDVEGNVKVVAQTNADFIPKKNYKVTLSYGLLKIVGTSGGDPEDPNNPDDPANPDGQITGNPESDPDSLGAGAIAGIVIAAVVVVGVVAFCVVWFVVLKKGCGSVKQMKVQVLNN